MARTLASFANGKNLRFYGDSITHGGFGSGTAWVTQLSTLVSATPFNYGTGGRTMEDVYWAGRDSFNLNTITTKTNDDAAIFIAFGVNDIDGFVTQGLGFSPAGYKAKTKAAIQNAKAKGWAANEIVILTPFYWNQAGSFDEQELWRQAGVEAAAEEGVILADIHQHMADHPDVSTLLHDGLHLNGAGNNYTRDFLNTLDYTPQTGYVDFPVDATLTGNTIVHTMGNVAGTYSVRVKADAATNRNAGTAATGAFTSV